VSPPIPNAPQNPQFAIRYNKKEIVPPAKKQVDKVLVTATGRVKLCGHWHPAPDLQNEVRFNAARVHLSGASTVSVLLDHASLGVT
jgi:hypothetical protein